MNKKFSNTVSSIKKDLKKELRNKDYDKGEDTKTLLNILVSFCYIGNALENFGKIIISLTIIAINACLIEKNIKSIKFFSAFPMMSFFGLGTLTFLVILLHLFFSWLRPIMAFYFCQIIRELNYNKYWKKAAADSCATV